MTRLEAMQQAMSTALDRRVPITDAEAVLAAFDAIETQEEPATDKAA